MDALDHMRRAIDYIEDNLEGEVEYAKIAQLALCSQYHFQRMFVFLVGVPLSEYIRRRRLTLAAIDLQKHHDKVIDVAVRYGYSSADAFTRAFRALHGVTPVQVREKGAAIKLYPPITFTLSLKGVQEMNYKIERRGPFRILGVRERFSYLDDLGTSVGKMWAELPQEIYAQLAELADSEPGDLVGAYSEMYEDNTTDYYIGVVSSAACPDDLVALEVPDMTWAIFEITGAMPQALANTWERIHTEFFPTTGYEHAPCPEVEWYSQGDMSLDSYRSEIWIPVITK